MFKLEVLTKKPREKFLIYETRGANDSVNKKSLPCKLFIKGGFPSGGKKFIKGHSALQHLAVKTEKSV